MKIPKIESFGAFLARLSKREKIIFYCAVSFVSLMSLDRLIISPVYLRMRELNKEIQEEEAEIKKNLRILALKDKISAESAKFASFSNSAKSEEEEMTSILKEVENLANKTSVYLVDMKPGGVKEAGASKKYLVNLNCEGQMDQIVNFMYEIENSNKLLTIEKYQISPKTKESSVTACVFSISKALIRK